MSADRFNTLQRKPLIEKALSAANPPVKLVKGARIRFAPGQPSGIHQHPISTCGVVTEGQFGFKIDGEAEQILNKGDAFFEPVATPILKFDNASDQVPAENVCSWNRAPRGRSKSATTLAC